MYGWVGGCMDRWVDRWVDGGWLMVDGWIVGWMHGLIDG